MGTSKEKVIVEIVVESKGTKAAMNKIDKGLKDIRKSSRATADSMQFFRDVTGLATFGVALGRIAKAFFQVNIAQQRAEKGFEAILGSTEEATQELEYAADVADRLGLKFYDVTQALSGLTATAHGTVLEGAGIRQIFEAISGTMARLGKSSEDTKGALKAIEQMISKGSITGEEWRQQLGERLPGAMKLLAESMGKTTKEVDKLMEAGAVDPFVELIKVADLLENKYDLAGRIDSLQASFNRLTNSVNEFYVALGKSGVIDAVTTALESLTRIMNAFPEWDLFGDIDWQTAKLINALETVEGVIPGMVELQKRLELAQQELIDYEGSAIAWLQKGSRAYDEAVQMRKDGIEALKVQMLALVDAEVKRQRAARETAEADSAAAKASAWRSNAEAELQANLKKWEKIEKRQEQAQKLADRQEGSFLKALQVVSQKENALNREYKIKKMLLGVDDERRDAAEKTLRLASEIADLSHTLPARLDKKDPQYQDRKELILQSLGEASERMSGRLDLINELDEAEKAYAEVKAAADEFGAAAAEGFASVVTGAESANDALANVLDSLAAMVVEMTIIKPLAEAISTGITGGKSGGGLAGFATKLFTGVATGAATGGTTTNALGNSFSGGTGLSHGVYSAPTTFPINGPSGRFAMGTGLLGEAGPEAVLPLSRGPGGKLGVTAEGSGQAPSVTIINNAPGVDVSAQQGLRPQDLEIVVAKVSSDISRGGSSISRSIEGTYALKRGRAAR